MNAPWLRLMTNCVWPATCFSVLCDFYTIQDIENPKTHGTRIKIHAEEDLPNHVASLTMTNINVLTLTGGAIVTGRNEHLYHAANMDSNTTAELNFDQTWRMVDDLLEAYPGWLLE